MKERGIPFTGESVRAIQEDQNTMTRRVIKIPEGGRIKPCTQYEPSTQYPQGSISICFDQSGLAEFKQLPCPYGQVGDLLYVKETFAVRNDGEQVLHKAAYEHIVEALDLHNFAKQEGLPPLKSFAPKWRSPRFMPKWAARIWLEITGLRAERLQEITGDDVKAEGCNGLDIGRIFQTPRDEYMLLWDTLNAKRGYPWASNPWVWVISFKRVELTVVPGK